MKKKRRDTPAAIVKKTPDRLPDRSERRKARLAKRKAEETKDSEAVFLERMKSYPSGHSPKTLRTRGYYRFAKDYPTTVDAEGFRENLPPARKLPSGRKFIVFLLCAAVFCITCTGIFVGTALSEKPGDTDFTAVPKEQKYDGIHAMRITYEEMLTDSPEEIAALLETEGCNTALFEFKDADGYVLFPVGESRGSSSVKTVENAWETVSALEAADIRTAAYISCFRDSAALADGISMAVRDFDNRESALIDNKDSMWLDPYMPEVTSYLKALIQKAVSGGFSYIVLDNVCFPCDLGLKTAYYSSKDIADHGETSVLLDFIAEALGMTGANQLIVMCDAYGFAVGDGIHNDRYGDALITCGAELFAADARLSYQISNVPDPLGIYTKIESMPTVFMLDVCSNALETVKSNEQTSNARVLACVEYDNGAANDLLAHTGLKDFIIW